MFNIVKNRMAAFAVAVLLSMPMMALYATPVFADAAVVSQQTKTDGGQVITVERPNDIFGNASDTVVTVPVGTFADEALKWIQGSLFLIVPALVMWAFRNLPPSAVALLRTLQVEQLLTRALDYGINMTRGAVKGKELEVNVGNEVIANGLQYVVDHGPGWLLDWMGGENGVRDKLIARVSFDASADSTNIAK